MKVLLTGAGGFIGTYVGTRLLDDGFDIVGIARSRNWRTPFWEEANLVFGDIADLNFLNDVFEKHKPSVVLHLAAAGVNASQGESARVVLESNVLGTHRLLIKAAKLGVSKVIVAGSVFEYGDVTGELSEEIVPNPDSLYAETKSVSTLLSYGLGVQLGLPIICLRLFTVYGPFEGEHRLVPSLIRSGLLNRKVAIREPEQRRDFIYVEDVYQALKAMLRKRCSTGIYNLAAGVNHSVLDVVNRVNNLFDREVGVVPTKLPHGIRKSPGNWRANIMALSSETGFQPQFSLNEGLSLTANWFHQRDKTRKV